VNHGAPEAERVDDEKLDVDEVENTDDAGG